MSGPNADVPAKGLQSAQIRLPCAAVRNPLNAAENPNRARCLLLLDVFLYLLTIDLRGVDIAAFIRHYVFGADPGMCRILVGVGNERCDRAILGAPDSNSPSPVGIPLARVVGNVDHVLFVDKNPARTAELRPLFNKFLILIENLNAIIPPVGDKEPAL